MDLQDGGTGDNRGRGGPSRDDDAFAVVVGGLREQLFRQAMSLTRDRGSAEDLVQDALERALAARFRFQPGTNLRAWLGAILKHRFIDVCRENKVQAQADVQPFAEGEREPGPMDVLSLDDVLRAAGSLQPEHRELVNLAYVQQRSYRDIALHTGTQVSTVGTRLFRVRTKLRRLLEQEYTQRRRALVQEP